MTGPVHRFPRPVAWRRTATRSGAVSSRPSAPCALEGGGDLPEVARRVRDLGHADAAARQRGAGAARADRRQPRRGRPARATPRPGWWDGLVGPGARSTPTAGSSSPPTCSAAARAPPARRRRRRTAGRGGRASRCSRPRPGRGRGRARRRAGHRPLGRRLGGSMGGMRALEWAVTLSGPGGARLVLASAPHATADQIAWCAAAGRGHPGGPGLAAAATTTTAPGAGPHAGLGIARRIAHSPTGPQTELDLRFGRKAQADEQPLARPRPLRGGVLPGPPRGQAGPPLRRRQLRRAHRGHEQPRRRARPRRDGRSARASHRAHRGGTPSTPTGSTRSQSGSRDRGGHPRRHCRCGC